MIHRKELRHGAMIISPEQLTRSSSTHAQDRQVDVHAQEKLSGSVFRGKMMEKRHGTIHIPLTAVWRMSS